MHDGPGLRTTVFFKGCPLRCLWCSNPESQKTTPQIMFYKERCIGCGKCTEVCESGAITTGIGCTACGKCVNICVNNARKVAGKLMTTTEVMDEILRDKLIFEKSGGGVTLSGGEVLMQPDFALDILKSCRESGIHTLLDTSAHCHPDKFAQVVSFADHVYIDMKSIDANIHKQVTAVDNTWILENYKFLDSNSIPFSVRMPIIPGYNDSEELMDKTIAFLKKLKSDFIVYLLPYHAYGKSKYDFVGMEWKMGFLPNMDRSALNPLLEKFKSAGLNVTIQ